MPGATTDTVGLEVEPNSFVIKRGSSILNKELLDKMLGKNPKKYAGGGTVPIIATPQERIATPEEVDMYGLSVFRAINNSSDNAAHDNMDALITQAELSNMKPMLNGGEVTVGYNKGGKVKNKMQGYENGGSTPSNLASYISQMQAIPDMDIRKNEPLSDLDSALKRLLEEQMFIPDIYKQIGIDELNKLEKKLGYSGEVEGSERRRRFKSVKRYPDYFQTISALEGDLAAANYFKDKFLRQDRRKQSANRQMDSGFGESAGYQEVSVGRAPELISGVGNVMNFIYDPETGESKRSRNIPIERPVSFDIDIDDISKYIKEIEEREKSGEGTIYGEYFQQGGMVKKKKNEYREGGLIGYQNGDVVDPDDPLQIDKRMADPSIYSRSVISGKFGDKRGIPEAWMQPATEPMPSEEDKKEFEKQLNRLKIDLLINKILAKDSQDTLRPKGYQEGNIVSPNNLDSLSFDDMSKIMESDEKKKTNELMEMIKVQGIFNEPERNYASYFEKEFEVPSNMAGSVKKAYSDDRDMENQRALELLRFMGMQSGNNMMDYAPSKSVPMPTIDKSWYVK